MLTDFRAKIQKYLDRGESVQVVAPPGFGKSRFGSPFPNAAFLDFNLVAPKNLGSVLDFFKSHVQFTDHTIIVLDEIDELLTNNYEPFWVYLKAIRDQHKYHLAYLFLVQRPISSSHRPLLGDLFEIASEHIEYLPALEPSEYDLFGSNPSPKQLLQIQKDSGGIPALVKICAMSLRDNSSLNPDSNPKLAGLLEEMLSVSPDHPAYTHSQIIRDFLTGQSSSALSASETRLLDLLTSHSGQLVSKDQICEAVYPDVKNKAGISDHAIDQLVHRLRSKIKDQGSVVTHRGLGYKLSQS